MGRKRRDALTLAQIREGYAKAISTALRLVDAASALTTHPEIALALFQIAQEELGKSFSLLVAAGAGGTAWPWADFWRDWLDHSVKSHRAFLYELICPLRMEVRHPDGTTLSGFPMRKAIPQEKEAGLYTDFDAATGRFVGPEEGVQPLEVANRGGAALLLANKAAVVGNVLNSAEPERRFAEFGKLAYRLMTEPLFSEHMKAVWDDFAALSPFHRLLVEEIGKALPYSTIHGATTASATLQPSKTPAD